MVDTGSPPPYVASSGGPAAPVISWHDEGRPGRRNLGGCMRAQRWSRSGRYLVAAILVSLVAAACGGGDGNGGGGGGDEGKPKYGGKIVYGLEGITTQFCIPRAQLAISGILVAEAVYDTLTRPTRDPNTYAPYLAKSVTPNADFSEWTIVIRDGVTFHDGTPLTAEIVKLNIDSWRKGILLGFVFENIADTQVTAPGTVVVKMKRPWVAFPAYLWATGRAAIAAPAQIENFADNKTCDTNMIGTGPFKLKRFDPNTGEVSVVRNENYWRKGFPYLDGIDFKIQGESSQRINGLQAGEFDVTHFGWANLDTVKGFGGVEVITEPEGRQEVAHGLTNVTRPPFDDPDARKAIVMALDRQALNQIANRGKGRLADQVFDTEVMGHLDDPNFPKYDPDEARKLVAKYKAAHGGKFEFELQTTFDQTVQQLAQEIKRQLGKVGITVNLPAPVDQATIINKAIGSAVDAFSWRNYPGQDPDTMYVWFRGGSVVNFNKIDDPVMNEALDQGRVEPDPEKRRELYERFNRRMSEQAYNLWLWYSQWFVGHKSNVHGLIGPNLPDESGEPGSEKPVDLFVGYHQMLGIWRS